MFISEENLRERLNKSNQNLDSLKFSRDRSRLKNEIDLDATDESIKIDSTPVPESALTELESKSLQIVTLPKRGRPEGYKNKSENEKLLIGLEARLLGQTVAAKANDVSQPFAGLCENGKKNTDASSPVNGKYLDKVNSEVNELRSQALEGLKSSTSILTGKLSPDMKVNDAIGVASTLVKIISISTPEEKKDQASRLVIMAPPLRDEKFYEVIDLN